MVIVTKYYHISANKRKRLNYNRMIETENGIVMHENRYIKVAFTKYFSQIFTSSTPEGTETCLLVLENVMIDYMNKNLLKTFTVEEVKNTLFHISPYKSLSPNGNYASFFKLIRKLLEIRYVRVF